MNDTAIRRRVRRRRTWYRRRLRLRRILVAVVVGVVIAGACLQNAASYFSSSSWRSSLALPDSLWNRGKVRKNPALLAQHSPQPAKVLARIPGFYPYSVVPGGLKDAQDLRYAALRDYVVRQHYAHFNFANARLLRATEAREVYLSYRIRNTVFWTRKKVRLHPGELLLTDGNITARARCGNQISDTAKPEVSEEEPDEDVLDQPVAIATAPSFPARPFPALPDLPSAEVPPPQLFANGFIFPYAPIGVPLSLGPCPAGQTNVHGRCKQHKPPVVPEPPTTVLLGSGLALILWRYRRIPRPAATARPR